MIVFAINNKFSYTEVDEIMLKIKETCPDNVKKDLVGNKMELEDDRKVLYEQAAEEVLLKGI